MSKVLVTGASGFIGGHLVAALTARGDEVTCLVRETSAVGQLRALGARLVVGDVTSAESLLTAVAGQQVVYHLAGLITALRKRSLYAVNSRGVARVAEACARQETPPVLICVSSLAAAGPAVDGRPRSESDPPTPVSHYGRSKRLGERAARRFADRVPITIVRPPIVLGEGDRVGLPLFRSAIRFGVHVAPGYRPKRFSLIHAADLVQLLILAAERGKRLPPACRRDDLSSQGCYFAACEQDPTYAELGRLVGESVGRRVLVIPAGPLVILASAAVCEAVARIRRRPMVISLDKFREIAAGSWLCSAQAAKEELGFTVAGPLVERLRQTAQWYEREGWL